VVKQITLKQACELVKKLNEKGYNAYFKSKMERIGIIVEYVEIKNGRILN